MSTLQQPWAGPQVDAALAADIAVRRPRGFDHRLAGHPLMSIDAIAELGQELGPDSISAEDAVKPLVTAEPAFRELAAEAIADRIRSLAAADSWFTLLNIEQERAYRELVDELVEGVAERAGLDPAGLRRRMGFVFASSPGSVTPAHFDIEHSLLMQLRGRRRLSFGRFGSPEVREREINRYWTGSSFGRLESMPEPVSELELGPGSGAYIPPYTPHWLSNGEEASYSLTVTFFERSNEDESRVQVLNERLRRLGITPKPYGAAPARDRSKAALMRWYAGMRRREETSRSH
ncbi:cupin domain-containing protein [Nocardioides sp. BP30]|uniref:JmjC domain-containing protein n=1 Tax=Nocardioides sp. BP30 TaxID=3036374 RepID=UPI002468A429|nr:cupin domain-containing protein [Nocardioides sp. BP30]WGL51011.1 cupin domain-containing protein [Nocardioides sp. BP30]